MKKNNIKTYLLIILLIFCFSGCSSENETSMDFNEIKANIQSGNYDNAKKLLDEVDDEFKNDEYYLLYADYYQDRNMGDDSRAYEKRDYNSAAKYLCDVYKDKSISEIGENVKDRLNDFLAEKNVTQENKNKIINILHKNNDVETDNKVKTENKPKDISTEESEKVSEVDSIAKTDDNSYKESESNLVNSEFPGIYSGTIVDYSSCRDTSNYEDYSDGYISFAYPTKIYNNVNKQKSSEGCTVEFTGSDNISKLTYSYTYYDGAYNNIKDITRNLYDNVASNYYKVNQIIYSDESLDHGRFIFTAYTDSSEYVSSYCLCTVEQDIIKLFVIEYPTIKDKTSSDYYNKEYLVDYLYRKCNFSGTTYLPRSFEQFSSGNMGVKK